MDDETQTTGVQDAPAADDNQQADTAPSQDSAADVQVDKEAPEAPQDTEEEKSPDTNAKDTAEERLYAGKYKTPEEMEKAYKELNSKATRDAQDKAELAKILNEAFVPDEPTPQATATEAQAFQDEYDEPSEPVTVDPRIEVLEQKDAIRDFIFMHPDADGSTINEVLKKDPLLNNITGYQAKLEYAYLKSKEMSAPQSLADAQKKATKETIAKTAEKQAAQVEGARQQAQPAGEEPLTGAELQQALRGDKSFDDLIQKKFPGISKMRTQT